MTRRQFFSRCSVASAAPALSAAHAPLALPVRLVFDRKVSWRPFQLTGVWPELWGEAVRDFGRCGVQIETTLGEGEIQRPPGREPVVLGLEFGVLNLVLTTTIPIQWDHGLALAGVTARYRGRHLCMVALNHAHCHQIPFLSVNTCVHELLHALMQDIFETRPSGLLGEARESRIDYYATRLWLLRDGSPIRAAVPQYLARLRDSDAARISGNPTDSCRMLNCFQ